MSTYSSLSQKYNRFAVPAYKITSGGTELKRSEFVVSEIAVDNCTGETSGAARFTLTHVYERGSRQFNAAALKNMYPGTKVSVSLGYGSDLTEVFTGYIDELKTRFCEDEISLTAMCLDARGLMRSGSAYSAVKDKKIQDIATAILDKYSALVTSKDVKLDSWEQEVNLTQAGGDLDFLCNAAKSRGLLFYIDCGKAVVGAAKDKVCVEFDWEQFELDFSVRYLDEKLTVYGYDTRNMEAFSSEATIKHKAKQGSLLTLGYAARLPHYINKDSAKSHAEALAKKKAAEAVYGKLRCVGLPEVKIGEKVKINKFPLTAISVADSLTVVSVSHRFENEQGFNTEIGVEGG